MAYGGLSGIDGIDTADDDDLAEFAFGVADAGGAVVEEDGEVLEGLSVGEFLFDNGGGSADGVEAFSGDLADDACSEGGAWEGHSPGDFVGEAEELGDFADVVFAEGLEGFEDLVAEGFLGVDADLGEDVVLAFDAGDGFLDVGKDGAVEEEGGL